MMLLYYGRYWEYLSVYQLSFCSFMPMDNLLTHLLMPSLLVLFGQE